MQIILLEKVVNVGNLGEVVRVRDGYARNFLIPQKKARRATEAALKEFELRRAELEKPRLKTGCFTSSGRSSGKLLAQNQPESWRGWSFVWFSDQHGHRGWTGCGWFCWR